MSALAEQIDELANQCCKKMENRDRKEFFAYQKAFRDSGKAYKKKYEVKNVYFKGAKAGQVREVYDIDGVFFNKIWSLLYPYVLTSATRSFYYRSPEETREDISDVRAQLVYVFRFFGPSPFGKKFSQCFPLVVNNVLTTCARRRGLYSPQVKCQRCGRKFYAGGHVARGKGVCGKNGKHVLTSLKEKEVIRGARTRVSMTAVKFSDMETSFEESGPVDFASTLVGTRGEDIEFLAGIPDSLRTPVSMLLGGESLSVVAEKCKIDRQRLRAAIAQILDRRV